MLLTGSVYTVEIVTLIHILNHYNILHKAWQIKAKPQFALAMIEVYITCGPGTDTAFPPP